MASAMPRSGSRTSDMAVAAGPIRSAVAISTPTICAVSATATAITMRNANPIVREGTPALRAASGATLEKSNGRYMSASATSATVAIAATMRKRVGAISKTDPKSSVLCAFANVVCKWRKSAPSPSASASTRPVATSRSRARSPSAPTAVAAPTENAISPTSGLIPASIAPAPPVNPISVTACPANERPRSTTKYPIAAVRAATIALARSAASTFGLAKNAFTRYPATTMMRPRTRKTSTGRS